MDSEGKAASQRILDAEEKAILQRILDAMARTEAGSKLVITYESTPLYRNNSGCWPRSKYLWLGVYYACVHWLPSAREFADRGAATRLTKLSRRIIAAAQTIQRDLPRLLPLPWSRSFPSEPEHHRFLYGYVEHTVWLEQFLTELIKSQTNPHPDDVEYIGDGSVLTRLVGHLAETFETAFQTRAGYTVNPNTGDIEDGPFIQFVEQALCEFGVTVDGNQPYSRAAIAKGLSQSRKLKDNQDF
jgi:hypothetical protein